MAAKSQVTFGVVVGNRGFFPDQLAKEGREQMIKILKKQGYGAVALTPAQTKYGTVETYADAKKCAELFAKNRDKIDGIIVTLPNFGDEKGVAETIKLSELNVPVLIHAFPDELDKMSLKERRDSFCGKLSVCNNLRQYGLGFTLTSLHTEDPASDIFLEDLADFARTCRVTRALKNLRVGAVGARPAAFNTCRFSEKLFQDSGITIETWDLSEVLCRAEAIKSADPRIKAKVTAIEKYVPTKGVPKAAVEKLARLAIVLEEWVKANEISALAVQCWTAIEEFYGVVPCTVMSMLSSSMVPAACEVDVAGAVAMYVLQSASGKPSALLDWNNNYGEDPNRAVMFHCSNFPINFLNDPELTYQDIIAGVVGKDNAYGVITGRIGPGPATLLRLSTDDYSGTISGYVAEGEFTDEPLDTFGGTGVLRVDNLQFLLEYVCQMGFEHHVAANKSHTADAVVEALVTYMGWDIFQHES